MVTVLMPVYNGEMYLREAITSVLRQSFGDFEFLIIEDGSTDSSLAIIESFRDPRIIVVRNQMNKGLIYSLNKGFDLARGEYIARMDCDDISLPERLSKQVAYMTQHQEVGICGTWSKTIGEVKKSWKTRFPTEHTEIVAHLLFNTAITHPTAMFNVAKLRALNLKYDASALDAEDYDLWVNAFDYFSLGNVGETLFLYRVHIGQTSKTAERRQRSTTARVRAKMLAKMGIKASDDEISLHNRLSDNSWEKSDVFYTDCNRWFSKMERLTKPIYKKAVRLECLRRMTELHKFVFGHRRIVQRALLLLRGML